jgi:hypothetical protein
MALATGTPNRALRRTPASRAVTGNTDAVA